MIGKTNATVIVGGVTPVEKEFHVQVVDYDGTRIVDERYNNGEIFTLPNPPTHSRLTFVDWVSNAPIVNNQITVTKDILIGISYTTVSGQNEFDFELTKNLAVAINTTGTKDWGDGTSDTLKFHTYSSPGIYTVKTSDNVRSSMFIDSNTGINSTQNLKRAFLANGITFQTATNSCFDGCSLLESVSLSPQIITLGDYTFRNCYNLKSVTCENVNNVSGQCFYYTNVDTFIFKENESINIQHNSFNNCPLKDISFNYIRIVGSNNYNKNRKKINLLPMGSNVNMVSSQSLTNNYYLEEVIITSECTSLPSKCFSNCVGLKKITLPNTITTLNSTCFSNCISLEKIKLPSSLTTISTSTFSYDYNLIEYDFSDVLAVPTLSNVNAFIDINPKCKMYVPDDLYNTWITSTNWINFAYYIYKASEKPQS